jgi:YesN/AraC family two-component response regulator
MPLRTLIVDDEPDSAESIARGTRVRSTTVAIIGDADNGALALEKISADQPDLVLLDLQMPEMGGLEVVRNLKRGTHMRGS